MGLGSKDQWRQEDT